MDRKMSISYALMFFLAMVFKVVEVLKDFGFDSDSLSSFEEFFRYFYAVSVFGVFMVSLRYLFSLMVEVPVKKVRRKKRERRKDV